MTYKEIVATLHTRYILRILPHYYSREEVLLRISRDLDICEDNGWADKALFIGCPHGCVENITCQKCWERAIKEFESKEEGPVL